MNQIDNVQGMRGIAFLMIFLAHACGIYFPKIEAVDCLGAMGVQIFFVISGYLIAFHYGEKIFQSNVWYEGIRYSFKKLKKFYPLHIITFLFFVGDMIHRDITINLLGVILDLTLMKAWYPPSFNLFNGVSWFLSAILFVYFLVPFTVRFFSEKKVSTVNYNFVRNFFL